VKPYVTSVISGVYQTCLDWYNTDKVFLVEGTPWSDISESQWNPILTLWLLVFFRRDTYIYDPVNVFLNNIQDVICWCFTKI